jgi:hypothetical protein
MIDMDLDGLRQVGDDLERLRAHDARQLVDAEVLPLLAAASRVVEEAEALRRSLAGEVARRELHLCRETSAPVLVAEVCEVERADAARWVREAHLLDCFPLLAASAVALGAGKVRQLLRAAASPTTAAFTASVAELVEVAKVLSCDELRTFITAWRRLADQDGRDPFTERRASAKAVGDGVALDAWLPGLAGAAAKAALDLRAKQLLQDDQGMPEDQRRTPTQARADALIEACQLLASHPAPGRDVTPEVLLCVGVDDLEQGTGHATTSDRQVVVPIGEAQAACCDSLLRRCVLNGDGEVLDLGRSQRLFSGAQRKAIKARDARCRFGRCTNAVTVQVHHLAEWDADHGPTDLANGALLCAAHHRLLHTRRWKLRWAAGGVLEAVHEESGTVLCSPPPPRPGRLFAA